MITAIKNARIFNGESIIKDKIVLIDGERISNIGGVIPTGATIIDANNATLLPGLIDSHVHTDIDGLHDALSFGVTTELEMSGKWSSSQRKKLAIRYDLADFRSPGIG